MRDGNTVINNDRSSSKACDIKADVAGEDAFEEEKRDTIPRAYLSLIKPETPSKSYRKCAFTIPNR